MDLQEFTSIAILLLRELCSSAEEHELRSSAFWGLKFVVLCCLTFATEDCNKMNVLFLSSFG